MPLEIHEILRSNHVMRWNIVNTSRQQSVAEHQYNVCMIARHLCKKIGIEDENVMKAALEHDLDEVRFGDIPSPTKEMLKHHGVDINAMMNHMGRVMTEQEAAILKIADMLDAILFLRDHAIGTQAKSILDNLFDKLFSYVEKHNTGNNSVSLMTITFEILQREQ